MEYSIPLHGRDGNVRASTMVDYDDWLAYSQYRWQLHSRGYVTGSMSTRFKPRTERTPNERFLLHRVIAGARPGEQVDHINGDRLDNRRSNLRVVSNAGNAQNQGSRGGSSQYRGVTWDKRSKRWIAQATLNGRHYHLGTFTNEDDAGVAAAAWRVAHMPHCKEGT